MSTVAFPTYRPQVVRTPATHTRLVLTARGRRVITLLIAVPLALAAFFAMLSAGQAAATDGASQSASSLTWITVDAGETLWSLAEQIAPTKDPRDVVAEIVSLNQLHSEIQPGMRIALPAGY